MEKKYRLTDETIVIEGAILHRIEALRNFADVHAGDKGGFVEKEDNLSHVGVSWLYGDAGVRGNARVCGDAVIFDGIISGNTFVYGALDLDV